MDPLSQGLLGAGLAQSFAKKHTIRVAAVCGILGGMAPDLDIFIRSATDPLLRVEYHRHFTHSLAFIPIGGLLVALFLWLVLYRKRHRFWLIYSFTTLGFATHGLLDACTSYGTRLYWPFVDTRVSWNIISIIDPIYTGILFLFAWFSLRRKSPHIMRVGLCLSLLFLGYGYYRHEQVKTIMYELAEQRGHTAERILLNPTIANHTLWRSVYVSGGYYYVDAVRVGWFGYQIKEGTRVANIPFTKMFPQLDKNSVQYQDMQRFNYFSQGYVYKHPKYENVIADLRYGTLPYDTHSFWAIRVNPQAPDTHVAWMRLRNIQDSHYTQFWRMLWHGFE